MHEIVKLWVRPEKGGAMVERDSLAIEAGHGVVGDHAFGKRRHVTIVFEEDWADAVRDLGIAVEPMARRANVLVSGAGGERLVGTRIRLGEVELEMKGVVDPCRRMDEAEMGLKEALKPSARAGVWGTVTAGGTICVGDQLTAD